MSMAEPFPDVELALVTGIPAALADAGFADVTAGDSTPSNLEARAATGFVRVGIVADPDDAITRRATVDVECFATTRARGYALGEAIRGIMLSRRAVGGMLLDRVETVSGPKRVPWDENNEKIRRFLATYRISTRR